MLNKSLIGCFVELTHWPGFELQIIGIMPKTKQYLLEMPQNISFGISYERVKANPTYLNDLILREIVEGIEEWYKNKNVFEETKNKKYGRVVDHKDISKIFDGLFTVEELSQILNNELESI